MTNLIADMTLDDEVVVQADDFEVVGRVVKLELRGGVEYRVVLEDTKTRQNWVMFSDADQSENAYVSEVHKPEKLEVLDASVIDDS
jgi:hypothetical protein